MSTSNMIEFLIPFPLEETDRPATSIIEGLHNLSTLTRAIQEMAEEAHFAARDRDNFCYDLEWARRKFELIARMANFATEEVDRSDAGVAGLLDVLHGHLEYRPAVDRRGAVAC